MKLQLSIRVKLFLSNLLAILVSSVALPLLAIRKLDASPDETTTRGPDTNSGYVRCRFDAGANQISSSLPVPAPRPRWKHSPERADRYGLSVIFSAVMKALRFFRQEETAGELSATLHYQQGNGSGNIFSDSIPISEEPV